MLFPLYHPNKNHLKIWVLWSSLLCQTHFSILSVNCMCCTLHWSVLCLFPNCPWYKASSFWELRTMCFMVFLENRTAIIFTGIFPWQIKSNKNVWHWYVDLNQHKNPTLKVIAIFSNSDYIPFNIIKWLYFLDLTHFRG